MRDWIGKLARDAAGGTAIEYGLIASLIVVGILAALISFGQTSVGMWTNIADHVANVT